MKGLQLSYKIKQGMSGRFSQKMFGRISSRTTNGRNYAYYIPGILDDTPYFRLRKGEIFIADKELDYDSIMGYVDTFLLSSTTKDDDEILMRTGKQKWRFHIKERGIKVDGI